MNETSEVFAATTSSMTMGEVPAASKAISWLSETCYAMVKTRLKSCCAVNKDEEMNVIIRIRL
jgi:hypothetical protein